MLYCKLYFIFSVRPYFCLIKVCLIVSLPLLVCLSISLVLIAPLLCTVCPCLLMIKLGVFVDPEDVEPGLFVFHAENKDKLFLKIVL